MARSYMNGWRTYDDRDHSFQLPIDWYCELDLLNRKESAREIVSGIMNGATIRLPKHDLYNVISTISKMQIPRQTLEGKVMEKKPKTKLRWAEPKMPDIRYLTYVPQFKEVPDETKPEMETKGEK